MVSYSGIMGFFWLSGHFIPLPGRVDCGRIDFIREEKYNHIQKDKSAQVFGKEF